MKKIGFLFATLIVAFFSTTLLSCDSESDTPEAPAAKQIEGTYSGDLECTVMGSPSVFEAVDFTVTATDESTVTVVLPAFGEAPMALPSITVSGVKVTGSDGTVTLATTETTGQTESGRSYTCTFAGIVNDKTLELKFNLQYGAMPMPLICTSTARKH